MGEQWRHAKKIRQQRMDKFVHSRMKLLIKKSLLPSLQKRKETLVILDRRLRRTFEQWRTKAIILTRLRQSLNNLWMSAKTLLNVKRRRNLTSKRKSAKSREILN